MERLQKVMAKAGVASRRRSEELILRGHVEIDGKIVREMGVKIDPTVNKISVFGKEISVKAPREYIILNKPSGYLTTVKDPYNRPTVMQLVGDPEYGLFPVGRLDQKTTGLLILTNDGDLAYRLTHPKHKVAKVYEVEVRGAPDPKAIWKLRNGVILEDGKTRPAEVSIINRGPGSSILTITIHEGKKRQVRRMCQAINHPVIKLNRLSIGPIELGDLESGHWRYLEANELAKLKDSLEF